MNKHYLIGLCIFLFLVCSMNVFGATVRDFLSQPAGNASESGASGVKFNTSVARIISVVSMGTGDASTIAYIMDSTRSIYLANASVNMTTHNATFNFITTAGTVYYALGNGSVGYYKAYNTSDQAYPKARTYVTFIMGSSNTGADNAAWYNVNSITTDVSNSVSLAISTPLNNSYSFTSTPNFYGNVSSIGGTWNVSLVLNGTSKGTRQVSSTGLFNITSSSLSAGEYNWSFRAVDSVNSANTVNSSSNWIYIIGASNCVVNVGGDYLVPDGCYSTY